MAETVKGNKIAKKLLDWQSSVFMSVAFNLLNIYNDFVGSLGTSKPLYTQVCTYQYVDMHN